MAKDFKSEISEAATAFDTVTKGAEPKKRKPRATHSKKEIAERKSTMRTQGVKGANLDRVNMSLTPENYEFIHVMARVSGLKMTDYFNKVLDAERERQAAVYRKAKAFADAIGGKE